ncbi:5-bromo-4-chloroindolyl phosphate hydrolysis family protein [Amaricoccus solimangrovi]|uniref:5-bromo-4-chloroindolyl phosphate hydrolysis protein n=1 Tax=Amaricoccus solimangrovi TaxID=2589815 RepID=A0A501WXA2_9RHOB|nr:5-bromo-4-chloroindolyl phosphate hydrolysis family protein [Amaricoccus solimangrovi]TPE50506.1 hypothetical protein FJM51_11985 [Amaricoccus solimangrovi]
MAGQRYGGPYSPDGPAASKEGRAAPPPPPFRNRRASNVSFRARLMFALPAPLLFAGLFAIGSGDPAAMLADLGGFAGLTGSAWLLAEGQRAEAAYAARAVARPPAIPRKLFAAALTGVSIAAVNYLSLDQGLGSVAYGLVAALAHVAAFGVDPMRKKGIAGVDDFAAERVAKAIDAAEELLRDTLAAAAGLRDRRLRSRVERVCDNAREVFRVVERDPRDLPRSRAFLSVYLLGLRDATVKYADLADRGGAPGAKERYEALLSDLETSFSKQRTHLLEDNRGDLDIEIEVLRDRLRQDGLVPIEGEKA